MRATVYIHVIRLIPHVERILHFGLNSPEESRLVSVQQQHPSRPRHEPNTAAKLKPQRNGEVIAALP
jgi:hypothetical protein